MDEARPLQRRLSRGGARRHVGANAGLAALVLGLIAVFAIYDTLQEIEDGEASVQDQLRHDVAADATTVAGLDGVPFNIVLGRAARTSVTASVWCEEATELLLRWRSADTADAATGAVAGACAAQNVTELVLDGLAPDTRYEYRIAYRRVASPNALAAGGPGAEALAVVAKPQFVCRSGFTSIRKK